MEYPYYGLALLGRELDALAIELDAAVVQTAAPQVPDVVVLEREGGVVRRGGPRTHLADLEYFFARLERHDVAQSIEVEGWRGAYGRGHGQRYFGPVRREGMPDHLAGGDSLEVPCREPELLQQRIAGGRGSGVAARTDGHDGEREGRHRHQQMPAGRPRHVVLDQACRAA